VWVGTKDGVSVVGGSVVGTSVGVRVGGADGVAVWTALGLLVGFKLGEGLIASSGANVVAVNG
jgi:hypothetical protein